MGFDASQLETGRLYSRPRLAELWGYKGYQAFARGVFTPSGHNEIASSSRARSRSSMDYSDRITI